MHKKIIKTGMIIIGIFLIGSGIMFIANLCPPQGPWPMPPRCSKGFTRNQFAVETNATKLSQIKAINMVDTRGRNYNMSMFEDTRKNIEESFDRVKALGAEEIYVHDFHRAVFDKESDYTTTNYKITDETFRNDMRDQSISAKEIKKLVKAAHDRGLKLGIKHNIAFVNIGKYILKGIKGEIQENVVNDFEKFNTNHTEERIRDYFTKRTARLIEKGEIYQEAGVDIMSISPTWMEPTFAGHESLANELQKKLITEIRKVFTGKIYVEISPYGFLEGKNGNEDRKKYDFYQDADIVEVRIYDLMPKFRNMQTNAGIAAYINELDAVAKRKGIKLSLFLAPSSYKDSMKQGALEVLDYKSDIVKNTEADFDYQAEVFESFFKAVSKTNNIERINVASFARDDAMDPEVKPKISIASTFRNKKAEEVIKNWFNK